MSGLGDEVAALRASLAELRVGVARRWAARSGAALPGSMERAVRRVGLRALDVAPGPAASARGRDTRDRLPPSPRERARTRLGGRRGVAGLGALLASLLGALLLWRAGGAFPTGAIALVVVASAGGAVLGLALLLRR